MARIGMFTFILQLLMSCVQGQNNAANRLGHCHEPRFDQKVASMLRFDVPAWDVDSLQKHPDHFVILDARAKAEYEVSHLPNARWCNYPDIEDSALKNLPLHQPIAVYCSIGYRSERIARELKARGFTQVINVYGSIFEWANRGYTLHNATGQPVKRVHGYNASWSRWVSNKTYELVVH